MNNKRKRKKYIYNLLEFMLSARIRPFKFFFIYAEERKCFQGKKTGSMGRYNKGDRLKQAHDKLCHS
jgi:hypothetical protein